MRTSTLVSALAATLALATASSQANIPTELKDSVYVAGSHYTAVLHQQQQDWTLTPLDGHDLTVNAAGTGCTPGGAIPEGVWLVTRGDNGAVTLTAPSATELPAGFPAEIALSACGDTHDGRPYVAAPKALIEWLSESSGAVLVAP